MMLLRKWSLLAVVMIALFAAMPARAQFGVELSGSYDIQSGTYVAPCGCTFGNGKGFGYMAAASMDLFSLLGLTIGVKPAYEVQQFTSEEVDPATHAKMAGGDKQDVKINFLSVEPFVRYDIPVTGIFLQVAPSIKYLVSSTFHHSEGASADADEPEINPDTAITLKSALFNAKATLGYSLTFLGIGVEPSVSAALPLTNLSDLSDAKNWAVTTLYLSLAVRL